MEMQQIRYFLAVAQELNFTRAAEICQVSQPALTRAIQALETELGGPLFHRERANTHLSELGRIMEPYLISIRDQASAAAAHAKAARELAGTTLNFGAMCTIGPSIISDFLINFRNVHSSVDISLWDDSATALMGKLKEGALEVGVMGLPDDVSDEFHTIRLFQEKFVIVLPMGHRLAQQNAVRACDLNDEAYINRRNCEIFDHARQIFRSNGSYLRQVFSSERDDWVLGMVRAGMGLGLFPEFSVFPPDVAVRPLIEPAIERTISLVTVRGRPHSPAVGAFVQGVRRHRWPSAPMP